MLLRMIRKIWNGSPDTLGAAVAARPAGVSRRDFLRAAGITTTTVAVGGGLWLPDRAAAAESFGVLRQAGLSAKHAGGVVGPIGTTGPTGPSGVAEALGMPRDWFLGDPKGLCGEHSPMLDSVQTALRYLQAEVDKYEALVLSLQPGVPDGFHRLEIRPVPPSLAEQLGDPLQQLRGEPVIS